jgi:hypothetical protein
MKTGRASCDLLFLCNIGTIIQSTDYVTPVTFLLDPDLDHADIRDDRGTRRKGSQSSRNGIMAEAHEAGHGKIADSNRTPLADPILARRVPNNGPGKGPGSLRDRVPFPGVCADINIRISGGILVV